jgi:NitT/TauT family transport system permease protein
LREGLVRVLPILGLLAIWWALTTFVLDRPRLYPTPGLVLEELVRIVSGETPLGSSYGHAAATLYRLAVAFVLAFVIGTLGGIVAGRRKGVFDFLNNLIWIAMAVPSIVWVFIFVIALGIRDSVPIIALTVLLAPPTLIAVAEGAKSVSADMVEMAKSFKVSGWQRLTGLYIPSTVPYMAASARVTFALGIKIVIIAEVIGLPSGIGLLLKYWFDSLFMAPVVAWGIILIIVGLIGDYAVFGPLERRAARWVAGEPKVVLNLE